jgi:hypothetical protein
MAGGYNIEAMLEILVASGMPIDEAIAYLTASNPYMAQRTMVGLPPGIAPMPPESGTLASSDGYHIPDDPNVLESQLNQAYQDTQPYSIPSYFSNYTTEDILRQLSPTMFAPPPDRSLAGMLENRQQGTGFSDIGGGNTPAPPIVINSELDLANAFPTMGRVNPGMGNPTGYPLPPDNPYDASSFDASQFDSGTSMSGNSVGGANTGGPFQWEDGSERYYFNNQQAEQDIPPDLDSLIMDEILSRLINPAGNVLPEQANAHRGMAASRAAQAGGGSTQDVIQRLMGDVQNSDARRLRERGNNVPTRPAPEPHPPGVPLPQLGPSRTSLFGATANPKQPTYINNSTGYDDFGSVVQNTGSAEIAAILAAMANPLLGLPNFFDPPSDVEMVYSSADGIQPSRQSISDYLYDQAMQGYDPFAGPPDTSLGFDDPTGSGASIGGVPTQGPARVPPWQVLLNGPSKTTQQGNAGTTTTRPRRSNTATQRQSTPRPAPAPAPSRGTAARTVAAPPPASTPTRGTAVRKAGAVPSTVGRSR